MVSVSEARRIISENIPALPAVTLPLFKAAGKILAADIYASVDIPAYPQSSMDGYAFLYSGWQQYKKLKVTGESAAGPQQQIKLSPENCIRIFTGAPVPHGADTVVMQEKINIENGHLLIEDEKIVLGNSVRAKGSEIKAGALALAKNSLLTPAAIGFLAGIGVTDATVYPDPTIAIIITGNELQQPGKPLQYGQVYESNSVALKSILRQLGIEDVVIYTAEDKLETVIDVFREALSKSDLVLLTGGISVGDYDFVLRATQACGVQQLFYKVKQRPGKPLFFGKKENKVVFGLPGNPSSVLTCFYEYVLPALGLHSKKNRVLHSIKIPLAKSLRKNVPLTLFLKGIYDGSTVTYLDAQESYRMSSFAAANCLIKVEEDITEIKEGELVEAHLFHS